MIKNSESEFNTQFNKDLICPYCGHKNLSDCEDYGDQDEEMEHDCSKCESTFIYITDYNITFCTARRD